MRMRCPEVGETPISRPGDVWIMGQHRLLCGDSTVAESYARLMQGDVADMVFTDPPYNVNYANSAKDKMRGKDRAILNDNLGDGFYDFLLAALTPTVAHCRGGIYVAMSSSELDVLQAAFRAAGGKWSTFIIWAKNTFTLGRADYQRQYEPILYGWPEGARKRHWCGDRDQGDVWHQEAAEERSAPDDEAGGAGRAGDPQFEPPGQRGARSVRWFWHDADCGRKVRPRRAADRTRSEVRGCDRAPVGGLHRPDGYPRGGRPCAPVEWLAGLLGLFFLGDAPQDLHRGEIARQCHAHDAHGLLDGDVWTPVGNQPTQRLLPFGGGRFHQAAISSQIRSGSQSPSGKAGRAGCRTACWSGGQSSSPSSVGWRR
jgi:hypothetical protein